jgi:hypothetical protein
MMTVLLGLALVMFLLVVGLGVWAIWQVCGRWLVRRLRR